VLQARLGKETDGEVKKAIEEGVALLQLSSAETQTQLSAVQQLQLLNSMGAADTLKRLADKPNCRLKSPRLPRTLLRAIEGHSLKGQLFWHDFSGV